jgi:hypothetical protein
MVDCYCPPSIVKSQPQPFKTWIWKDKFGFLQLEITNIFMHLEPTNSSIARKRNHTLPFFNRYTTEKAISERLGLAIASPVRAHYFEFAGEHLALEENRGHFLESWRHQLSNDAYQFGHFFFHRRIYSLCHPHRPGFGYREEVV